MLGSSEWTAHNNIDTLEAYTDALGVGLGVWFPGKYVRYQWPIPPDLPFEGICSGKPSPCAQLSTSLAFTKSQSR
jgi:hypothetical protein